MHLHTGQRRRQLDGRQPLAERQRRRAPALLRGRSKGVEVHHVAAPVSGPLCVRAHRHLDALRRHAARHAVDRRCQRARRELQPRIVHPRRARLQRHTATVEAHEKAACPHAAAIRLGAEAYRQHPAHPCRQMRHGAKHLAPCLLRLRARVARRLAPPHKLLPPEGVENYRAHAAAVGAHKTCHAFCHNVVFF